MKRIELALKVTDNNLSSILELFGKTVDKDGYIVEKANGKKVICPYSKKEIHRTSFSILPGSSTFVNNEAYCFAEHLSTHFDQER
jgi:hypothetical protein